MTWTSSNPQLYYFEVQLSKDQMFDMEPVTATSMVYSALIHGGVTAPPNSYRVPDGFPLEPGVTYYWRVRPRIQGDGQAFPWLPAMSFRSPGQ